MSAYRDSFERCPRCAVELVDARSARACPQCRGLWLREAVLSEMVIAMLPPGAAFGRLQFADVPQRDRIACPSCGQAMELASLADVIVDRCAAHGVWFDTDELERALAHTALPPPHAHATYAPPAPGVPVLRFHIFRAGAPVRTVDVQQPIIKLGTLPTAHVRLDGDPGIARLHAVIEVAAALTVIDLGTPRGTLLDGARIAKATVVEGSELQLGDTQIVIEILARS